MANLEDFEDDTFGVGTYTFGYGDEDLTVNYEFTGDVSVNEVAEHLRRFLLASSWGEKTVRDIGKALTENE